jgi:hypothetical protein
VSAGHWAFLVGASLSFILLGFGPGVLIWWPRRCFSLSWHHIVSRWPLTEQSEKVTCSCGKSFGINHAVQIVLPWDSVKELYEGPNSILRPPSRTN